MVAVAGEEPAGNLQKRQEIKTDFEEALRLLGRGPLVGQSYFIPLASIAQAETGVSDAPNSLLDTLRGDNHFYRKSEELLEEAADLYENEQFDESHEKILEAQKYARLAEKEVEQQLKIRETDQLIQETETLIKKAEDAVAQAKKRSPSVSAPAQYKEAQIAYAEAKSARITKDWTGVSLATDTAKRKANETIEAVQEFLKTGKRPPASAEYAESSEEAEEVWVAAGDPGIPAEWAFFEEPLAVSPMPSPAKTPADQPGTGNAKAPAQPNRPASPPQVAAGPAEAKPPEVKPAEAKPAGVSPAGVNPAGVNPAGGRTRTTPEPPTMAAKAIGPSPRVPGSESARIGVSSGGNQAGRPDSGTSAPARIAIAPDNTPPVPVLSPLNVSSNVSSGLAAAPAKPETPARDSVIPEYTAPHITSSLGDDEDAHFAAQYRVEPWESSADCLWNIAGKPWVYSDPQKWPYLYRANSSKLPNPENPHLIRPNLVLDIPSINGEARQGPSTWEGVQAR
jgi:hypothetical protein